MVVVFNHLGPEPGFDITYCIMVRVCRVTTSTADIFVKFSFYSYSLSIILVFKIFNSTLSEELQNIQNIDHRWPKWIQYCMPKSFRSGS